jgi:hypothetical protein
MIALDSTSDTVVMLFIAAGVGLIGGIAAGLLDMGRAAKSDAPGNRMGFWASVFLGGVSAVAILYFFPPAQETVREVAGGAPETTTEYDLTQLVALALIVGSAGSGFLVVMQTRALALASAERTAATQATATQAISGVADQAASLAKAGVSAAAPQIEAALQQAAPSLSQEQMSAVVSDLADQAETAVADNLEPQVESAQQMVVAASATAAPAKPAVPPAAPEKAAV